MESRQRLQTFNTPPSLLIDNAPIKLHLLNLLVFMWMRICRGMYMSTRLLLVLVS